ncbi:MAG: outer membrane protein assembly factor BamC [Methylococcales bacterium]
MSKLRVYIPFMILCLTLGLGGCSGILPDREKEYQYSSELPPLEIPPDMTGPNSEDPMATVPDASGTASLNELQQESDREPVVLTADTVRLVDLPGGSTLLEIDETFPRVWRIVGKALSRLELEVTDRDRSIGIYYFLYDDPEAVEDEEAKEVEEDDSEDDEDSGGLFEDLAEIFSDETEPKEVEFRAKLEEENNTIRLVLLDQFGQPQSQGTGLRLLKMIREKILSFQK